MEIENRMNKYIQLGDYSYSGIETVYDPDGDLAGFKTEVIGANILGARALTNGYQGGDASHGSHSYIEFEDLGSTAMEISVCGEKCDDVYVADRAVNKSVRIDVYGDTELMTLINALRFMADALEVSADYAESKFEE